MEEWKEYKVAEVIEDISMGPFGSDKTGHWEVIRKEEGV